MMRGTYPIPNDQWSRSMTSGRCAESAEGTLSLMYRSGCGSVRLARPGAVCCAAQTRFNRSRLNVLATYVERVRVRVPHRVPVHGPLCVCVPATRNQLADQWVGGASARMTHGVRDHDGVLRDQVPLVREVLGAEVRRGEPERVVEPRNLLPRRLAEVHVGEMSGCRVWNSTACSAGRTLAMARRYGRFFSSSSFGRRSRPQTRSISAWAFSWMSGQPAMWAANHCWIDAVCVGENEWLC